MFYEEKVIDGQLMFRTDPDGPWRQVPLLKLTKRFIDSQALSKTQEREIDQLKMTVEAVRKLVYAHLPKDIENGEIAPIIEDLCFILEMGENNE